MSRAKIESADFIRTHDFFRILAVKVGGAKMKKKVKHARTTSRARTTRPETNSSLRNARAAVSEQNALSPPYVVGPPLNYPAPLTFVDFLQLKHTKEIFGMRGDVADMLGGLTSQPDFLKASISKKADKTTKAQWKKLFSEHVRRSYLQIAVVCGTGPVSRRSFGWPTQTC